MKNSSVVCVSMNRPAAVLREYWDEVLIIEETAVWFSPEYVEVES